MKFEYDHITPPEPGDMDLTKWRFCDDLRHYFPNLKSNHEITDLLTERGVISEKDEADSESSATWIYFTSEEDANAFIDRLNAQPEVANWVDPMALNEKVRKLQVSVTTNTNINLTSEMVHDAILHYLAPFAKVPNVVFTITTTKVEVV